ncbi:hypothetical protein BDZ89DRAFT_1048568 [Hymenopellis radicata]|nr:hypothetical protein BDZ89DRAFT_1048568 [Hymenopellis radicata]
MKRLRDIARRCSLQSQSYAGRTINACSRISVQYLWSSKAVMTGTVVKEIASMSTFDGLLRNVVTQAKVYLDTFGALKRIRWTDFCLLPPCRPSQNFSSNFRRSAHVGAKLWRREVSPKDIGLTWGRQVRGTGNVSAIEWSLCKCEVVRRLATSLPLDSYRSRESVSIGNIGDYQLRDMTDMGTLVLCFSA